MFGSARNVIQNPDPFQVLGVRRSATLAEVRQAYRDRSKVLHPDKDRSGSAAEATARFQRLQDAYEVLCDPKRRQALQSSVIIVPARTPAPHVKKAPNKHVNPKKGARLREPPGSAETNKHPLPSAVDVLDSEEEEAVRDVADAVRYVQERKRARHAMEEAKVVAERKVMCTGVPKNSFVRLSLRIGKMTLTASDIDCAFKHLGARLVSQSAETATLSVADERSAVAFVLDFHCWRSRVCSEEVQRVYRHIKLATAPVSREGRAVAGEHPTVAASQKKLVACDKGCQTAL